MRKNMSETVKIVSLRIKFIDILNLIDGAIKEGKKIEISNNALRGKSNVSVFLKWLQKHKIIDIAISVDKTQKKVPIRSRNRKIQIALQLIALGSTLRDISEKFKVKVTTVQGYLKELAKFNDKYLKILNFVLNIKDITLNTSLEEFPIFPIRISFNKLKLNLNPLEFNELKLELERNKWIKLITGQNLGTQDISIILPKK